MKMLQPQRRKKGGSIVTSWPSLPNISFATAMRLDFNEAKVLPSGMLSSLKESSFLFVANLYSIISCELPVLKLHIIS